MREAKTLVLDIETSPIVAYVWGRRDQNIATNQINKDWHLMSWAAKWLGAPKSEMMYKDQRNAKDITNDKALITPLWSLLDEAEILVTQNGKNFDSRRVNARFIINKMGPPSPYTHLDTYQILRRVADFTSHSLEYLTDKINTKYKKLTHKKFPGMSLWNECMKGNMVAWDEMKKYNIHDVLATEELLLKSRAWIPSSMPDIYQVIDPAKECGKCGFKGRLNLNGSRMIKGGYVQRYQCNKCGGWQQGKKEAA